MKGAGDRINPTVKEIKPSGIRKFFDIAAEIPDAISLGVGEPDFVTPWNVRNAAVRSIQKGYTSYNYATSSARADLLKEYIEDSRTTNEALLYVCDIRTITDVNKEVEEASVRNWSDSLSLSSVTRLKGISSFLFTRDYKDCDIPSFYLDIIKYHSNYDSLKDAYQWSYTNTKNIDNIVLQNKLKNKH